MRNLILRAAAVAAATAAVAIPAAAAAAASATVVLGWAPGTTADTYNYGTLTGPAFLSAARCSRHAGY